MFLTYLGWPAVIITVYTFLFLTRFEIFFNSCFSGWLFTFVFLEVLWILEFVFVIWNGQLKDARAHIRMMKLIKNDINDEENGHRRLAITLARAMLEKAIEGNTISYYDQPRKYGEGPYRLENSIPLSEDIYSLAYASFIDDVEISKYIDIETEKLLKVEEEEEVEEGEA